MNRYSFQKKIDIQSVVQFIDGGSGGGGGGGGGGCEQEIDFM